MSAFWKAIEMNLKVFIQYRFSFMISIVVFPFILMVNVVLFKSIYEFGHLKEIQGYTLSEMIWYFAGVPFTWIFITNFVHTRISERIITGELTMDFIRPMSVFIYEFANAISMRFTGIWLEFFPTLLLNSLLYYPDFMTIGSLLKFILLSINAFLIVYHLNFLVGMSAFVLQNNKSVDRIKGILIALLGGGFVPLEFMPEKFRMINDWLPFKYVYYEPLQFFLNKAQTQGWNVFLHMILMQLLWVLLLHMVYRLLWAVLIKRYSSVGG